MIDLPDIREAAEGLRGVAVRTPLLRVDDLEKRQPIVGVEELLVVAGDLFVPGNLPPDVDALRFCKDSLGVEAFEGEAFCPRHLAPARLLNQRQGLVERHQA